MADGVVVVTANRRIVGAFITILHLLGMVVVIMITISIVSIIIIRLPTTHTISITDTTRFHRTPATTIGAAARGTPPTTTVLEEVKKKGAARKCVSVPC
jgi:hypothetical protein